MPTEPFEPIIEIQNADIVKEESLIISDLNITINKGELVYLVGRVGSGKTSIVKTIIGEIPLIKGEAKVAGYTLSKLSPKKIHLLRRKIGVVFQDFQLLTDRSVYDNLKFVLQSTGWKDSSGMDSVIKTRLESVGMQLKAHKMPHQLSGGEQQRVAIARALLNNPEIILADEPTGNLDSETSTDIMNLLMKIHSQEGPAIIIVTHNRSIVKRYPGRVLLCENLSCTEIEAIQEIDITRLLDDDFLI
ncbi:MAG: ATP-binding cassette domain-containing protein [Bacteroidales bacterium]|jgi:cell division transport system ATP-binding protein|nr:ATP-binding cassette domain-containing protein [Bacteroidales bacterium]MDD3273363.1 ATP-binding cassette domain-containing protein [Bacteroidales bacterium]MDD4058022.1 ATP-binding cassette domain-containing protein [Bacteroidales bacterium]